MYVRVIDRVVGRYRHESTVHLSDISFTFDLLYIILLHLTELYLH